MLVTITQYRQLARDANGNVLPAPGSRITSEARTSAGAFAALDDQAKIIRLATDTAIQMDSAGGTTDGDSEFYPGNYVEFIPVNGGETLTIAAA